MSTIQPTNPIDPSLLAGPRQLDRMTQAEVIALETNKDPFAGVDPELVGAAKTFGPFLTGLAGSFTGKMGLSLGLESQRYMEGEEKAYATPVNWESKTENPYAKPFAPNFSLAESLGDYQTFNRNNIEAITEDLRSVPSEEWPYILEGALDSYGEYRERLDRVKLLSPEFSEMGSFAGKAVGFGADASALISLALVAEPVAFAGVRGALIGAGEQIGARAAVPYFGRIVNIATEAAEASRLVSTTSNVARYAALGVAEELTVKLIREAVDPWHNPDVSDIATDMVFAGTIGAAIGGWAGRAYVSDLVESTARRYSHRLMVGKTHINLSTTMPFTSFVEADAHLIAAGVRNVDGELNRISASSWEIYSTRGTEFVPGSEFTPLPILQNAGAINRSEDVGASLLAGTFDPRTLGPTVYSPADANMMRLLLMSGNRYSLSSALRGMPEPVDPSNLVFMNRRAGLSRAALRRRGMDVLTNRGPDRALARDAQEVREATRGARAESRAVSNESAPSSRNTGIEIEVSTENLRGSLIESGQLFRASEEGDMAFKLSRSSSWDDVSRGMRSVTVRPNADPNEAARVIDMLRSRGWRSRRLNDGTQVFTPPRTPRFVRANESFEIATQGIQSNILAVVAEVQRRGGEVTQELTTLVTQAMYGAYRSGLRGAAAEAHIWNAVNRALPENVAARIAEARRLGNGPELRNLSRDFDVFVRKDEYIEGLWNLHQAGDDAAQAARRAADADNSLVLQVAAEIRRRGGNLTREEFEAVVEDLRQLINNPPTRTNARGRTSLDVAARRAEVAAIINKRVPQQAQQIYIPRYINASVNRVQRAATASAAIRRAGGTGGGGVGLRGRGGGSAPAEPVGTVAAAEAMNREVPRLTGPDTLGGLQQLFNQAANGLRSANPIIRMFFFSSFNARRAMNTESGEMVAQGQTIFELGTHQLTGFISRMLVTQRNAYTRYALGLNQNDPIRLRDGIRAAFGRGRSTTKAQFNADLSRQIRTGAFNSTNDVVNQAARELRDVIREMHEAAAEAGVRGFQQGGQLNYLSRLYRWNRIERLGTTAEGRAAFVELLRESLGRETRQLLMEDGTLVALADVDAAAQVLADRLISLSTKSDNAPLLDIDQALADAIDELEGPLKAAGTSRTPFGRPRIILNEDARITLTHDPLGLGRTELSFADLLADDPALIMKRYTTSVMGAINERRLLDELHAQFTHYGILGPNDQPLEPFENFDQVLALANRIGTRVPGMGGQVDANIESSFREIISAIRYEPLHRSNAELGNIGRWADKTLSVLLPLGYLSTGGGFALAASVETSRIVGTLGMGSTLRQMPLLKEMTENWRNMDEGAVNAAKFIDQAFHPSTDRLRRALFYDIESQIRGEDPGLLTKGLHATANFFSDITLLSPVTSFTQHLTAAAAMQHLYDVGANLTRRMDDATIRTLGLEPEQYNELFAWVRNNAVMDGDRVVGMNNLHSLEFDNLRVFVDRLVRTRIQDIPTRGDFAKAGFSFVARLMTQFRTFNLKGVDNFLLQNISRARRGGEVNVAKEIAATMVLAGLVQYSRQYMNYKAAKDNGDFKKADQIADSFLGAKGFAKGALTGPSEFFLPILATDAVWTSTVSDDPLFSPYRYSGLQWYGFPAQSTISKGIQIGQDVYGATIAKTLGIEDREREITTGTIHKARSLIFGQNIPGVAQFLDITEKEVAQEFNLLKQQPRRD